MEEEEDQDGGSPEDILKYIDNLRGMNIDEVKIMMTDLCGEDENFKALVEELFQGDTAVETIIDTFKETLSAALQKGGEDEEDHDQEVPKTTEETVEPQNQKSKQSTKEVVDKEQKVSPKKEQPKVKKPQVRDSSSDSSSSASSSSSSNIRASKNSSKPVPAPITSKAQKRKLSSDDDSNSDIANELLLLKKKNKTVDHDQHRRTSTSSNSKQLQQGKTKDGHHKSRDKEEKRKAEKVTTKVHKSRIIIQSDDDSDEDSDDLRKIKEKKRREREEAEAKEKKEKERKEREKEEREREKAKAAKLEREREKAAKELEKVKAEKAERERKKAKAEKLEREQEKAKADKIEREREIAKAQKEREKAKAEKAEKEREKAKYEKEERGSEKAEAKKSEPEGERASTKKVETNEESNKTNGADDEIELQENVDRLKDPNTDENTMNVSKEKTNEDNSDAAVHAERSDVKPEKIHEEDRIETIDLDISEEQLPDIPHVEEPQNPPTDNLLTGAEMVHVKSEKSENHKSPDNAKEELEAITTVDKENGEDLFTATILKEKVKLEKHDLEKDHENKHKDNNKLHAKAHIKFEREDSWDRYNKSRENKDYRPKLKIGGHPVIHPQYSRYRKKFKLKQCRVVMYDIKKQDTYWREGDRVYRLKLREEKRQRARFGHGSNKHEKYHKYPDKKEKFSERGTRILEYEKRPENADLYPKKREIVREKAKTEQKTDHQKQLEALHRKEERKEREKRAKINSEFRIPKDKSRQRPVPNLQDHRLSSSTPLAPAVQPKQMHFDKQRLVTSTQARNKNPDSWLITPEEERALLKTTDDKKKREEKAKQEKLDSFDVQDDDGIVDLGGDEGFAPEGFDAPDDDFGGGDGEGSEANPIPESGAQPMSTPEDSDLAKAVRDLLAAETNIQVAEEGSNAADVIVRKCGKWFEGIAKEPYYQTCPSIPEEREEEYYTLIHVENENDDDDDSFFGNVSNPDGDDDVQDNEITSTARDPDVADEHCGQGLVHCNARLRVKPGEDKNSFISILNIRRGCNYDKQNFQASCNLCDEFITSKRHLGAHIRSSKHRNSLVNSSLKLIGMEGNLAKSKKSDSDKIKSPSLDGISQVSSKRRSESSRKADKSKSKDPLDKKEADRNDKDKDKDKNGHKSGNDKSKPRSESAKEKDSSSSAALRKRDDRGQDRRKRSKSRSPAGARSRNRRSRSRSPYRDRARTSRRSRSRSPRGGGGGGGIRGVHKERNPRSRSRSPGRRRRASSSERVAEFLDRNERSARMRSSPPKSSLPKGANRTKQEDNMIFNEKLQLQAKGRWTAELEGRWKLKEDEEEILKKVTSQKRKLLEERPEDHPEYTTQWEKFWETRYQQVQDQGKNPDTYEYTAEWKIFWGTLSEGLLQEEHDTKLDAIRKRYGMDLDTLRSLSAMAAAAPPPTPMPPHNMSGPPPMGYPPFMQGHGSAPPMFMRGPVPLQQQQQVLLPPGVDPPHYPPPPAQAVPMVPMMGGLPSAAGYSATFPTPQLPMTHQSGVVINNPAMQSVTTALPVSGGSGLTSGRLGAPVMNRRDAEEVYTPKSMSISDCGLDDDNRSNRSRARSPPKRSVTVDDIKSTWLTLTGQKITQAVKSAAGSLSGSSVKSKDYDYDGFDVVQVLRLMLALEDELSFLSLKVQEYYKQAESMELMEQRKSFSMLKDKEFVTVLFQCRDRFFAILRANVCSSDVMKRLNLAVFAMNALLESPSCQKLRPSALVNSAAAESTDIDQRIRNPEIRIPIPAPPSQTCSQVSSRKSDMDLSGGHGSVSGSVRGVTDTFDNPIAAALASVSQELKVELSSILASSFIAQGKDRMTESELLSNLVSVFAPILNRTGTGRSNVPTGPGSASSGTGTSNHNRMGPGMLTNPSHVRPSGNSPQPLPSRATNYNSSVPPLHEFEARAASPPAQRNFAGQNQNRNQNPQEHSNFGGFGPSSFLPKPFARGGNGGGGGGGSRGGVGSGGGWGRRDYPGSQIPEDQEFPMAHRKRTRTRNRKGKGGRARQNTELSPICAAVGIPDENDDLTYDEFKALSSKNSKPKQSTHPNNLSKKDTVEIDPSYLKILPPSVIQLLGSDGGSQSPPTTSKKFQNNEDLDDVDDGKETFDIRIVDISKLMERRNTDDFDEDSIAFRESISENESDFRSNDNANNNASRISSKSLSHPGRGLPTERNARAFVESATVNNSDRTAAGPDVNLDYQPISQNASDIDIHVDFGSVDATGNASTRIRIDETELMIGGEIVTRASSIITIVSESLSKHSVVMETLSGDDNVDVSASQNYSERQSDPSNPSQSKSKLTPGLLNLIRRERMSKELEQAIEDEENFGKSLETEKIVSPPDGDVSPPARPFVFTLIQKPSPSSSSASSCLPLFSKNRRVELGSDTKRHSRSKATKQQKSKKNKRDKGRERAKSKTDRRKSQREYYDPISDDMESDGDIMENNGRDRKRRRRHETDDLDELTYAREKRARRHRHQGQTSERSRRSRTRSRSPNFASFSPQLENHLDDGQGSGFHDYGHGAGEISPRISASSRLIPDSEDRSDIRNPSEDCNPDREGHDRTSSNRHRHRSSRRESVASDRNRRDKRMEKDRSSSRSRRRDGGHRHRSGSGPVPTISPDHGHHRRHSVQNDKIDGVSKKYWDHSEDSAVSSDDNFKGGEPHLRIAPPLESLQDIPNSSKVVSKKHRRKGSSYRKSGSRSERRRHSKISNESISDFNSNSKSGKTRTAEPVNVEEGEIRAVQLALRKPKRGRFRRRK